MTRAEIAVDFLQRCARGDVRQAYGRHVAMDFIHHNAWFAGDRESLLVAMEESAAAEPNKAFEVKQVIEGDDRVMTLSHLQRADGQTEYAVVHIARFVGEKIVALWDLGQEIPPDSPNRNGMF